MGGDQEETSSFPLTYVDNWVLAQKDEDVEPHTWDELKKIISANDLSLLKRRPSDLRRYISWSHSIKAEYGTMIDYLIQNRLPWGSPPFTYKSAIPFANPLDYTILISDWPYGLTQDITHIVVWTKTPIASDALRGDVTDESRAIINAFVERTFAERLGRDEARVL